MELDRKLKIEKILTSPNVAEMLTEDELNHIGYNVSYEFNGMKRMEDRNTVLKFNSTILLMIGRPANGCVA